MKTGPLNGLGIFPAGFPSLLLRVSAGRDIANAKGHNRKALVKAKVVFPEKTRKIERLLDILEHGMDDAIDAGA